MQAARGAGSVSQGPRKRISLFFSLIFAQTKPLETLFVRQVLSFSYQIQNLCSSCFASVSSAPQKKLENAELDFYSKKRGGWMFKEFFLQVKTTFSSSTTGAFCENSIKHKSLAWLICTLGIHLREISLKFRV